MIKYAVGILALFILVSTQGQELTHKEKVKIRRELKVMLKKDQEYRTLIANNKDLLNTDSLWKLQNINDSLNKKRFIDLIDKYGYPSRERIGTEISVVLVLHFTNHSDFVELHQLFINQLQMKNMPPEEFARWYDRCQINMGGKSHYGVYGRQLYCGEELKEVNEKRKLIGLRPINKSSECEN